jgi:hypothetical protein
MENANCMAQQPNPNNNIRNNLRLMKKDELVTVADLELFKEEIIREFRFLSQTNKSKPIKKLIKSSDVLKLIPVSAGKLHTMRINGILPYTRIGGNIYYEPDDIDLLIEKYKINNSNDVPTRNSGWKR